MRNEETKSLTPEEMQRIREGNNITQQAQAPDAGELAIWFDGKAIDEVAFCQYFKSKYPIIYMDGVFYGIDGAMANEDVEKLIVDEIAKHWTRSIANKAVALREALKYYVKSSNLPLHEDRIHFANGTYYLEGGFVPEKQFCANRLPVDYRPDAAKPTVWLNFLGQLLDEEDIKTLQEFIGYCMIPTTRAQTMLMIIGNGGEGKSRIGVVMGNIFGNNVNFCPIDKLASNRFCPAEQRGKLAMIDDDMKMSALENTGVLKMIVTAESKINLETKGKQAFQGVMYVRIMGFGNGALNALYDKSDGFYRRQIVLCAKERPEDRVDDKHFSQKLSAETDGIVLWAIEGLKRLSANGFHFTVSESAKNNLKESKEAAENVVSFLNSEGYIGFDPKAKATSRDLYAVYLDWCEDNAETPYKTAEIFTRHMNNVARRYGLEHKKNLMTVEGRVVRGFKGVYVKIRNTRNPFYKAS